MRQYQVRCDEWTGTVWMQRVTAPMSEKDAEKICLNMANETSSGGTRYRNIAVCYDMPVQ